MSIRLHASAGTYLSLASGLWDYDSYYGMSCWVYPFNISTAGVAVGIGYSGNGWCGDWMGVKSGVGYFYTGPDGTLGRENENGTVYLRRWNHLALVCNYLSTDYDERTYYVNGVAVASRGMDNDPRTAPDGFRIGQTHIGANPFNGLIANVRVWTRLMRHKEIVADMQAPFADRRALWGSFPLIARPFVSIDGKRVLTINGTVPHADAPPVRASASPFLAFVVEVQLGRPDADVSAGSWQPSTGATLYGVIDEATADDADYIFSSDDPANDECRIGLQNLVDPGSSSGHTFRYRYRKPSGTAQIDLTVSLYQSTTLIKANMHTNIGTSWTGGEVTLSAGEADSITDYTALELRFKANKAT